MRKESGPQKGFIHTLPVLLLLVGVLFGTYLVQQQTNFLPKAAELKQPAVSPAPGSLPELDIKAVCSPGDEINSYYLDVAVWGRVSVQASDGFWSTVKDEKTGQVVVWTYKDRDQTSITADFHGSVRPIRGESLLPLIGDGRIYTVRIWNQPPTSGLPYLPSERYLVTTSFSRECPEGGK